MSLDDQNTSRSKVYETKQKSALKDINFNVDNFDRNLNIKHATNMDKISKIKKNIISTSAIRDKLNEQECDQHETIKSMHS